MYSDLLNIIVVVKYSYNLIYKRAMFDIRKSMVEIPCSECNYKNKVSLEDIAKEKTIICGGCKKQIKLTDGEKSTKKIIKSVKNNISNLDNTIKRIQK
jgi:Zn finger protein HypA/HybF involved in hydrogenase expression